MNSVALIKKCMLIIMLSFSLICLSTYANWEVNRHYTNCWHGRCTHYEYHKYCVHGHCWSHWHRHNWTR